MKEILQTSPELGIERHLHLWPDKSLGSQTLADRMPNPGKYLKRLDHWWHRVSEWPKQHGAEVRTTRYRGGKMGDFTTRLHYTTDWFVDNEAKGVVKILTPKLPGAQPFTQKVGIMSQHPENYRQLAAHPELIPNIRLAEDKINAPSLKFLCN